MKDTSEKRFQVNLAGVIEILSQHIYSGPQVFVRELLQNATDAITARLNLGDATEGKITFSLFNRDSCPSLAVQDNGVGLTEDEIHQFLAIIGQSSKSGLLNSAEYDFIGQFGIGLLSCFMVSEEIAIHTRSARQPGSVLQWQGYPDGTYKVQAVELDMPIGTRVTLTARSDARHYFSAAAMAEWMRYYGVYLPHPVYLHTDQSLRINPLSPPWQWQHSSGTSFIDKALSLGEEHFGGPFFDIVPLQTVAGGVKGMAFIGAQAVAPNQQQRHLIYLKGMRLTDTAQKLLPDWAFFVRMVINSDCLKPTASREALHEDALLEATREELSEQLMAYLVQLAKQEPEKFQRFVTTHDLTLKPLTVESDYFCLQIVPHLSFETNLGRMTLGQYLGKNSGITLVASVDAFRQMAQVASAQGLCIINAGYAWDAQVLQRYANLANVEMEVIDPALLVQHLASVDTSDPAVARFLSVAQAALEEGCGQVSVKRFQPNSVPALYVTSERYFLVRSAAAQKEQVDELWGGIIGNIIEPVKSYTHNELCLNADNTLIQRLMRAKDSAQVKSYIKILYVHSLLMGHYPINSEELAILNNGMLVLMENSLGLWGQEHNTTQH